MEKTICVYSSSSDGVDKRYFDVAHQLGRHMAQNNYGLIYGGAAIGLMGAVARAVHEHGGKVVGIIPEFLKQYDIAYEKADQLIVTQTMRERKALMEERADAFIGLPGGFGTLEEILEMITLKQLQLHSKPVVILNTGNFYNRLIDLFEHSYAEKFAKEMHRKLYYIASNVEEAILYIDRYQPPELVKKWF